MKIKTTLQTAAVVCILALPAAAFAADAAAPMHHHHHHHHKAAAAATTAAPAHKHCAKHKKGKHCMHSMQQAPAGKASGASGDFSHLNQ